jgi:hypothetical protein
MARCTPGRIICLSGASLLALTLAACGGASSQTVSQPPPTADFNLSISPSSATVIQGSSSTGIQIGVQPLSGFSGEVQITLSGMPAGVSSNPQSPFTLASGSSVNLVIGASGSAAGGNANISVQGASGKLVHSRSIGLTVESTVASARVFSKAGFYKFILYDQKRQWLYLSNIDHLDVFDLKAAAFRSGILPPGGPPPNALIREAVLTPDGSKLVIADFGAQSVYLVNPDTAAGNIVNVGGVPGDANSGPARVATTSANTVFVGLTGYGDGTPACSACLQQIDLSASPASVQAAPQPEVPALTGAPLLHASVDGASAFLSFLSAPGQPIAGWIAATPSQFQTAQTNFSATDMSAAGDGTSFALRNSVTVEVRDSGLSVKSVIAESQLDSAFPQRTEVPGMALHPSGALVYIPFLSGPAPATAPFTGLLGGVDIVDANTGQLRLIVMLPEPLAMLAADVDGWHGKFMTVDENGQNIFALTASGLSVVQLTRVPLGIGSITPATGAAGGGTSVTVRGSGFVNGASISIGGTNAAATFIDVNTLKFTTPTIFAGAQRIVITNPGGESYSLDAAFLAI